MIYSRAVTPFSYSLHSPLTPTASYGTRFLFPSRDPIPTSILVPRLNLLPTVSRSQLGSQSPPPSSSSFLAFHPFSMHPSTNRVGQSYLLAVSDSVATSRYDATNRFSSRSSFFSFRSRFLFRFFFFLVPDAPRYPVYTC